mgnify:CR=1
MLYKLKFEGKITAVKTRIELICPYWCEMKTFRKELWFETKTRRAFINITPEVEKCLKENGIKEGLVL